jgi:hypothetical protein
MIPAVQKLFDKSCEIATNDLLRDGELQFQVTVRSPLFEQPTIVSA